MSNYPETNYIDQTHVRFNRTHIRRNEDAKSHLDQDALDREYIKNLSLYIHQETGPILQQTYTEQAQELLLSISPSYQHALRDPRYEYSCTNCSNVAIGHFKNHCKRECPFIGTWSMKYHWIMVKQINLFARAFPLKREFQQFLTNSQTNLLGFWIQAVQKALNICQDYKHDRDQTLPIYFTSAKPDQHDERAKAWALLTAMKHCAHRIPFKVLSHPSIDYFRNLSILPPSKL
eukprot:477855_1